MITDLDAAIINQPVSTLNYAKFDPANTDAGITLSGDNEIASSNTASHLISYLTVTKPPSGGLWSVEVEVIANGNNTTPAPFFLFAVGFGDSFTETNTYVGSWTDSIGHHFGVGYLYRNNIVQVGYFDTLSGVGSKGVIVFDFNNPRILGVKGGVLITTTPLGVSDQMYTCVSLFNNTGSAGSIKLNSGQRAYSASNEAALSAYEIANGVSINRGLWE